MYRIIFLLVVLFFALTTHAADPIGKFSASLSWKAPATYNNGVALLPTDIAGYDVRLAGKPADKWGIFATLTKEQTIYDYITTEIGEHCFQVRAFTKDIKGLWSNSVCKVISVVPGAPTEVKIIRFEWLAQ